MYLKSFSWPLWGTSHRGSEHGAVVLLCSAPSWKILRSGQNGAHEPFAAAPEASPEAFMPLLFSVLLTNTEHLLCPDRALTAGPQGRGQDGFHLVTLSHWHLSHSAQG